jgi:hypothetical protein
VAAVIVNAKNDIDDMLSSRGTHFGAPL